MLATVASTLRTRGMCNVCRSHGVRRLHADPLKVKTRAATTLVCVCMYADLVEPLNVMLANDLRRGCWRRPLPLTTPIQDHSGTHR